YVATRRSSDLVKNRARGTRGTTGEENCHKWKPWNYAKSRHGASRFASILAAGDKHAAANTNRLLRYSHGCWKLVLRLLCEVGRGHNRGNTRVDRKSTRLNSSHQIISYAVFC